MKMIAFAVNPTERPIFERYYRDYGIDLTMTTERPKPENVHLTQGAGCINVLSDTAITPELWDLYHQNGVRLGVTRCIGMEHMNADYANTLGIDIWEQGKTHSGNKMFMVISSVNMANNDWLISPQLNGGSQTISFWAKSFTTDDTPMERMRVLYSTTDTDPTHFTPLHAAPYIELPEQWGEFSYTLPAGARYFAVNCVSSGAFAMFVDDLSFNDLTVPQLAVQNYEVYRNGEKIGTTDGTEFTDATSPATLSGAVYKVRANYDGNRQSGFSEAVTFQPSGIDAIDGQRVSIAAHRGAIVVNGAEGLAVAVHRVDGVAMYATANAEPSVTIPASAGVYLVTVATRTVKVVVP